MNHRIPSRPNSPPASKLPPQPSALQRQGHVRVVLFASGKGSDGSTYMPNRSSTQWWNRRDALVRCVASSLFGPTSSSTTHRIELVLLFDQDWSRMHMTYIIPTHWNRSTAMLTDRRTSLSTLHFIPTEQNVIRIWKQCCQTPNQVVEQQGFRCTLITIDNMRSSTGHTPSVDTNSSKRDILDALQSNCPMEFLKQHRLNSSPQVLLRKANRDQLLAVWNLWCQSKQTTSNKTSQAASSSSSGFRHTEVRNDNDEDTKRLDRVLQELLKSAAAGDANREQQAVRSNGRVIAAVLHESSEHELPLEDEDGDVHSQDGSDHVTAVLFAGAVRDMTGSELQCVRNVCQQVDVPTVKVRLGPVAEFTSKVLSIVAFHHSHRRLIPGLCHALSRSTDGTAAPTKVKDSATINVSEAKDASAGRRRTGSRKRQRSQVGSGDTIPEDNSSIHASEAPAALSFTYIAFAPFDSSVVTLDLEARPLLWSMVRCVVTSLWRSRVASNTTSFTRSESTQHNPIESFATVGSEPTRTTAASASLCVSGTLYRNRLVLVFADHVVVDLDESTVIEMAERHQAAPCENQVLQLVLEQIDKQRTQQSPAAGSTRPVDAASSIPARTRVHMLLERIGMSSLSPLDPSVRKDSSFKSSQCRTIALDLLHKEGLDLGEEFYKRRTLSFPQSDPEQRRQSDASTTTTRDEHVLVIMSLEPPTEDPAPSSSASVLSDEWIRALSYHPDVDVIRSHLIRSPCADQFAAAVTLLQHVGYQDPSFFARLPRPRDNPIRESPSQVTSSIRTGLSREEEKKKNRKKAKKRKHNKMMS